MIELKLIGRNITPSRIVVAWVNDNNSETLSFLVPRYVSEQDLTLCDAYIDLWSTRDSDTKIQIALTKGDITATTFKLSLVVGGNFTSVDVVYSYQLLFDTATFSWHTAMAILKISQSINADGAISDLPPSIYDAWKSLIMGYRDTAVGSKEVAMEAASAASGSALAASNSATTAATQARLAEGSAVAAQGFASDAQGYAYAASDFALDASQYAGAAEGALAALMSALGTTVPSLDETGKIPLTQIPVPIPGVSTLWETIETI